MHLIISLILSAAILSAQPVTAQTAAPAPAQAAPPVPAQPQAAPGQAAPAQAAPAAPAQPKAAPARPPARRDGTAAPTNRTMAFDLPPLVPVAEIPRGRAVTIQGVVLSPQATTFVLNDGNASQVINIGPSWRDLSKVKAGDRIRVIGQMDPYGTPVFRAGSIMLENNRIVVVPTN